MKKITIDQDAFISQFPAFMESGILSALTSSIFTDPVVVAPVQPVTGSITSIARDVFVMADAVVDARGFVTYIPSRKGGETMTYQGTKNVPLLDSRRLISQLKGIFINNENQTYYTTADMAKPLVFPAEVHHIVVFPSFFDNEAIVNAYGNYLAFINSKLRTNNSTDSFPDVYSAPLMQNVHFREVYKTDGTVDIYVNSVKQSGSQKTFAGLTKLTRIGISTDTNAGYIAYVKAVSYDHVLSDAEFKIVYSEDNAEYKFGTNIDVPYLKDPVGVVTNGELGYVGGWIPAKSGAGRNESLEIVRWVNGGTGPNNNPTTAYYDVRFDGMKKINVAKYNLSGTFLRPEVTAFDTDGKTAGVPTSKAPQNKL